MTVGKLSGFNSMEISNGRFLRGGEYQKLSEIYSSSFETRLPTVAA